jgi:DNA-binding transcriptional MerR regulator
VRTFSIGTVAAITGIKAHTLRYWEERVPSLAAQKDIGSRRAYTVRDIATIQRLKHLMDERHLSLDAARSRLIEIDAALRRSDNMMQHIQTLDEVRRELLEAYTLLRQHCPD